jgi:uncharacterized protein
MAAPAFDAVRSRHREAARWPYTELDVAALIAGGWRPTPIREVVLKVHQRCNLACDYCYVYEHADQSWRDRPVRMSRQVADMAIGRLADHVRQHDLTDVRVVLHGGEPLLYGVDELADLADRIRAAMPATCTVDIGMQTNGVRLVAATAEVLRRHDIKVGVSVDGVAEDHDRHRRTPNGRGSFAAVSRSLDILRRPENRAIYAGILCTVAPETDALACYEQLLAFEPPAIDFLLPHANWTEPPWRPEDRSASYAAWLITVFDKWYGSAPSTHVRIFEDLISLILGGRSRSEQIGLSPSAVLIVESDGAIEQIDALKSAYEGACGTGLTVHENDFDAALDDPGVIARQIGLRALSDECLGCHVRDFCGAGHYAHRYRAGEGFRSPSVYCADLRELVEHVYRRVTADVRDLMPTGVS